MLTYRTHQTSLIKADNPTVPSHDLSSRSIWMNNSVPKLYVSELVKINIMLRAQELHSGLFVVRVVIIVLLFFSFLIARCGSSEVSLMLVSICFVSAGCLLGFTL